MEPFCALEVPTLVGANDHLQLELVLVGRNLLIFRVVYQINSQSLWRKSVWQKREKKAESGMVVCRSEDV